MATTATFINPAQRTLDTIKSCRTSLSEALVLRKGNQWIPPIYKQLHFILLLVELGLTKTRDFVHHQGSEQDIELAVKITDLTDAMDERAIELLMIIQLVNASLSISKWKAIFVSTEVSWRQGRVKEIMDNIMTYQVLLLRAGAPPLTSGEIADLVEKSAIQMDWRLKEHLTDLKAYQRGSISSPTGVPSVIGEAASNDSNVRRPSTFYNVYDGRIVGTINTEAGPIPQVIEGITPKPLTAAEEGLQKIVSRPGPTALQFESPHLGGLVLTSSVPEMNLALPNGDPARSNSVNSSQLPPPADPAEAFERVLREIRNAKSDASIYPGISIQCYRKALRIINSISDSSPSITNEILFYKAYYAAICEIGLSHIESPPSSHLDKASKYNEQALILVEGVNNTKLTPRATLNKAQIKQFIAEIQERAGTGNKSTIHSTIHESSTLYTTVINLLRGNCQGMADHHILAQALLGCGRVNKKLTISAGGWYAGLSSGGGAKRWSISRAPSSKNDASKATTPLQDPQACFYEALKVVEEGIAVGKVEGEIEEALDEITLLRDDIKKALSHLQRQTYSS